MAVSLVCLNIPCFDTSACSENGHNSAVLIRFDRYDSALSMDSGLGQCVREKPGDQWR